LFQRESFLLAPASPLASFPNSSLDSLLFLTALMARIALVLSYDGTPFNGWQTQAHGNGVQDHVERALKELAGEQVSVVCAGRTDTGVHASTQVIHFDTQAERKLSAWTRGLNSMLPSGIASQHALVVADDFHARFDAQKRRYHYFIYRAKMRQPILKRRAAWVFRPIDVAKLVHASQCLIGEHDFTSFRSSECQSKTPVRLMHSIAVKEIGSIVSVEFIANGFLHHMIRNLMGSLLYVAMGKQDSNWLPTLLASRDRKLAAPTFGAEGLYFTGVDYGIEHPLRELTWTAPALPWQV
jgi:tRNA pseudouridine38-40 synthase